MNKFLILIFATILALGLGVFYYKDLLFYLNINNPFLEEKYDPVAKVSIIETPETCVDYKTVNFAFYNETPINFEPNNKHGLYIYAERQDFFEMASELVNSNGGQWGYVLIPFNVKDRDRSRWERVFNDLNRLKLIPVIQLWDVDLDNYKSQTQKAAKFLNSFDWPVKYLYISVYNEPNDRRFWYDRIDPKGYAEILNYTIDTFKAENPNFLLLNGAFNVSASTNKVSMDSFQFMFLMNKEFPGIFQKLDAWASHSYPQPNFSGNPYSIGRWSIRAYEEELKFLKSLGVTKELPVFITETGWAHAQGDKYDRSFLDQNIVANYYKIAFWEIWNKDKRVRAVMPFTIKYDSPFDHFSWIKQNYKDRYPQFDAVKSLPKIAGNPPFLIKGSYKQLSCE